MPLNSSLADRVRLHARQTHYDCFRRADGLFEIECRLTDVKDHDYDLLTGMRPAGVPVHDIWARLVIASDGTIRSIDVAFDGMPYPGTCDRICAAYGKLVGVSLLHGFRKALHDGMGGVQGCSHITEMLSHAPPAAIQMFAGLRREIEPDGAKPFQLDRCHALETTTENVRRYYPQWYRGAA
jgi:hypothetical protein